MKQAIVSCGLILALTSAVIASANKPINDFELSQLFGTVHLYWLTDEYSNGEYADYQFVMEFRPVESKIWQSVAVGHDNHVALDALIEGTSYEFRLKAIAPDNTISTFDVAKTITVNSQLPDDKYVAASPSVQMGDFGVNIISLQNIPYSGGRYNFLEVTVDSLGVPWPYLDSSNFEVFEDGVLQTNNFRVTPPGTLCVRPADIVFLIDNSGSMCGEINDVKNNAIAFADSLSALGIDFRLGACRFGQWGNGGHPLCYGGCMLTDDINVFKSWINSMGCSGWFEPGIEAVSNAVTCFNWRPGSSRQIVLITDEDSDGGSLASAISLCNTNSTKVNVHANCSFGNSWNDYCGPSGIAQQTGGTVTSVTSPFWNIIDTLQTVICGNYQLSYKPSNDTCDGFDREVIVNATSGPHSGEDTAYYTPCMAPVITITPDTRDLELSPQLAGGALTLQAWVVDNVPPLISNVWLYYRQTGGSGYVQTSMINLHDSLWSFTVPGTSVQPPGVDYYVTATDGQSLASAPKVDPDILPYQIAVLPNEPPSIVHDTLGPDQPLDIALTVDAVVIDSTNSLTSVELYYRKYGDLLFSMTPMANSGGDNYSAEIPSNINVQGGCEYYLRAEDDYGLSSYHGGPDFPHQINIGQCNDDLFIIPSEMYVIYLYSVNPVVVKAYVTSFPGANGPYDVDVSTIVINDSTLPTSSQARNDVPLWPGQDVLEITFTAVDFIEPYMPLYNTTWQPYSISGKFYDSTSFFFCDQMKFIGHLSGDMNNDGTVDIVDLTYFVDYLFGGGPPPIDMDQGDMNHDGSVDVVDLSALVAELFY